MPLQRLETIPRKVNDKYAKHSIIIEIFSRVKTKLKQCTSSLCHLEFILHVFLFNKQSITLDIIGRSIIL